MRVRARSDERGGVLTLSVHTTTAGDRTSGQRPQAGRLNGVAKASSKTSLDDNEWS